MQYLQRHVVGHAALHRPPGATPSRHITVGGAHLGGEQVGWRFAVDFRRRWDKALADVGVEDFAPEEPVALLRGDRLRYVT